jgi:predicted nuclease with RNAse H fold
VLLDADQCQLVLIDYQTRLMPVIHDGERVTRKARLLARIAHLMGVPVWATTQRAAALGPFVPDLASLVTQPLDKVGSAHARAWKERAQSAQAFAPVCAG